ncbi:hypothetical protein PSKAS_11550 [Peribacillus sp. N1]
MTVEEIYKNREKFSQEVQRVASQDLAKMGLIFSSERHAIFKTIGDVIYD